jgi:hypothetical protein
MVWGKERNGVQILNDKKETSLFNVFQVVHSDSLDFLQEHPILGQPFFVLHPCKTNEFMTAVLKNSQKINR